MTVVLNRATVDFDVKRHSLLYPNDLYSQSRMNLDRRKQASLFQLHVLSTQHGCGSKFQTWGSTGFSLCFQVPRCHFGHRFASHSHKGPSTNWPPEASSWWVSRARPTAEMWRRRSFGSCRAMGLPTALWLTCVMNHNHLIW